MRETAAQRSRRSLHILAFVGADPLSWMQGFLRYGYLLLEARRLDVLAFVSGAGFARDRVARATGNQGLAESSIEAICVEHGLLTGCPRDAHGARDFATPQRSQEPSVRSTLATLESKTSRNDCSTTAPATTPLPRRRRLVVTWLLKCPLPTRRRVIIDWAAKWLRTEMALTYACFTRQIAHW